VVLERVVTIPDPTGAPRRAYEVLLNQESTDRAFLDGHFRMVALFRACKTCDPTVTYHVGGVLAAFGIGLEQLAEAEGSRPLLGGRSPGHVDLDVDAEGNRTVITVRRASGEDSYGFWHGHLFPVESPEAKPQRMERLGPLETIAAWPPALFEEGVPASIVAADEDPWEYGVTPREIAENLSDHPEIADPWAHEMCPVGYLFHPRTAVATLLDAPTGRIERVTHSGAFQLADEDGSRYKYDFKVVVDELGRRTYSSSEPERLPPGKPCSGITPWPSAGLEVLQDRWQSLGMSSPPTSVWLYEGAGLSETGDFWWLAASAEERLTMDMHGNVWWAKTMTPP